MAPDLNRIAETVRRNQQLAVPDPSQPAEQLYASPEGDILSGTVVSPTDTRLSRITQETFYLDNIARHAAERQVVLDKMPAGTVYASEGGPTGRGGARPPTARTAG